MKAQTIKQITTTALLSGAIILTGCSSDSAPPPPPAAPIGDISGTWAIYEAYTSASAGCSGYDSYTLTTAQSGNSVTVTDNSGNVFNGTLSGNKLTWSGSYPDYPGTTSSNVTVTIGASCTTLTATATWSYSETGFSCSGTSTSTGTRISGGTGC
ncbi:MAG: hypothetical protein OEZ38_09145 [Gammaproteobacteria bacterium]|nr:hypothetical protein [Gammaproteobacteria bacterium]